MNKKIIFYVLTFLIITGSVTSYYWIPKFRPFGNSTTLTDSTNYVTLNKGFYTFDSIKTDRDLIVRGAIVLDTTRLGKLYYDGNEMVLTNSKTSDANILFIAGYGFSTFKWEKNTSFSGNTSLMQMDTISGFTVYTGNIQVGGGTQQIKIPSDTASDYDGNNSITLNRQSGFLTTKSLTTAGNSYYDLTLVNSLITANTKIVPTIIYGGGTNTITNVQIHHVAYSGGNIIIGIFNGNGSSLNGTIKLSYVIFN